ncbi:MAG: hypothetical protein ACYTGB_06650 [Planctomycetota bacterium]
MIGRRGIALLVVLMCCASLLILGLLFARSVTCEYRAAVYCRQAAEAEGHCIAGLHRAMAELVYDVWGTGEDQPFLSARPETGTARPEASLRALNDAAYFDAESGAPRPILRQRGYWNGEAWVVWAGEKIDAPPEFGGGWHMDPRPHLRPEIEGGAQRYLSYGAAAGTVRCTAGQREVVAEDPARFCTEWKDGVEIRIAGRPYRIDSVVSESVLVLEEPYAGTSRGGLGWHVAGGWDCPSSADLPPSFPGGCQHLGDFLAARRGRAADPRWVDPARRLPLQPWLGEAFYRELWHAICLLREYDPNRRTSMGAKEVGLFTRLQERSEVTGETKFYISPVLMHLAYTEMRDLLPQAQIRLNGPQADSRMLLHQIRRGGLTLISTSRRPLLLDPS